MDNQILPDNWKGTTLGEIGDLIRGVTYQKQESSSSPLDDYLPVLRATNINSELDFDGLVYVPKYRIKEEQLVKGLDVVIAMSSGSKSVVGKAAQAFTDFNGGFGAFCGLFRINPNLDKRFIGFFFQSQDYRSAISALSMGVNINNLRREHIESMDIGIPPLPEQHRIVTKIEELFTNLDAGVEALKMVQAQVKRYRQAVLKYAFEGKLTAEWREAHKDELEPASELLERMREERKKKLGGKYKEPLAINTSGLPELPDGWAWATSASVCESVRDGTHDTPAYVDDGGVPLVTSKNLKETGLDFTSCKNISVVDHNKISVRSGVDDGDILFAMIGTIGNPVVVRTSDTFSIKNVGLFKKNESVISPDYLRYWLESMSLEKILRLREFIKGTTQQFIPLGHLRIIPVPLAPMKEQEEIVGEIERKLSIADGIQRTIETSIKQSDRLRQSILKKAFEGKLVPQDPNDEPADELLMRIREARSNQGAKLKRSKSRSRS